LWPPIALIGVVVLFVPLSINVSPLKIAAQAKTTHQLLHWWA
jgi:hypothetical protein